MTSNATVQKLASLGRFGRGKGIQPLKQLCLRQLMANVEHIGDIGDVPFELITCVLKICSPDQLLRIEKANPSKKMDVEDCWEQHCSREGIKQRTAATWRQTYLDFLDMRRLRQEAARQRLREKNAKLSTAKTLSGKSAIVLSDAEASRLPHAGGSRTATSSFRKAQHKPIPKFMQAYLREKVNAPKMPVFKKKKI